MTPLNLEFFFRGSNGLEKYAVLKFGKLNIFSIDYGNIIIIIKHNYNY